MPITIRKLQNNDIKACIKLFYDTVHSVNLKDYTLEQVNIWAPAHIDANSQRWRSLLINISLVAELNDELVGFIDMTHDGYLDRLFVHKDHQGIGVASSLLQETEKHARANNISIITTEASITAKPFFLAKGFEVSEEQKKIVKGAQLINYLMKKKLS